MKKSTIANYVIENGRFQEDAPKGSEYFVRFPTIYSSGAFFVAGDTNELVEKVFKFANSKEGKQKLASVNVNLSQYEEGNYQSSDEDDE